MQSEQPDAASADAGDQPARARDVGRENVESSVQDEPPTEQRANVAGEGNAAADMTPESSARAGIGRKETETGEYDGPPDPEHRDTDIARRENADIGLYRKHFSAYNEPRAHLSSNPYIESDQAFVGGGHRRDLADGKAALPPGKAALPPPIPLSTICPGTFVAWDVQSPRSTWR